MKESFPASVEPLQGGLPRYYYERSGNSLSGPKKAIRLILLGILLPGMLISIPLYLRYRVYDHTLYPIGMSDMRLIDNKVSTTWCQRQLVTSNTSFNAFLLPKLPIVAKEQKNVSMIRQLTLSDDMKEYWGFYMLKGSSITVSTCVRWPGASLIVIRGHRHLQECAYIGDESSEELDELMEAIAENGIHIKTDNDDSPTNNPDLLRKHNGDIQFHDAKANATAQNYVIKSKKKQNIDEELISAKEMEEILTKLLLKSEKLKSSPNALQNDNKIFANKKNNFRKILNEKMQNSIKNLNSSNIDFNERKNINHQQQKSIENTISSRELLQDMQKKLLSVNSSTRDKILNELRKTFINETENSNWKPIKEELLRIKRQLHLKSILNDENSENSLENENLAIEEGFVSDEHAAHHNILNETTLHDKSNSEFWSSFSSSEEALLNCSGLILSLPLTPHRKCVKNHKDLRTAALSNTFTYTVPTNGYYFFVFNSENEVQENYINVKFDLEKTVYDVSNSIVKCSNTTGLCSLPLDFFSNEKVVFELPVNNNDSQWNEEFLVISECEPRTSIYLVCVMAVPLVIILFAFQ